MGFFSNIANNKKKAAIREFIFGAKLKYYLLAFCCLFSIPANSYEKGSDQWLSAIIIGKIAYYGGNCETSSPVKHRKLQTRLIEDAFYVSGDELFYKTKEIILSNEFTEGATIAKHNGCKKTKKQLDSIVEQLGITEYDRPKSYASPSLQDKIMNFFLQ